MAGVIASQCEYRWDSPRYLVPSSPGEGRKIIPAGLLVWFNLSSFRYLHRSPTRKSPSLNVGNEQTFPEKKRWLCLQ